MLRKARILHHAAFLFLIDSFKIFRMSEEAEMPGQYFSVLETSRHIMSADSYRILARAMEEVSGPATKPGLVGDFLLPFAIQEEIAQIAFSLARTSSVVDFRVSSVV